MCKHDYTKVNINVRAHKQNSDGNEVASDGCISGSVELQDFLGQGVLSTASVEQCLPSPHL